MTLYLLGGLLALGLIAVARVRGIGGIGQSGATAFRLFRGILPLMVLGMLLAGMVQVILPSDLIGRWMGEGSGLTGVIIGMLVGMVFPGGPFIVLPIAASAMAAGAGVGAIAAFVTSWSVTPLERTVIFELPFLGSRFTVARFVVVLPFPILVGLAAPPLVQAFQGLS